MQLITYIVNNNKLLKANSNDKLNFLPAFVSEERENMKNNTRIIDFRYAPVKAQMCIGLVDDLYKTLVFDDGTIAFDYSIKHDLGYYQRISDKVYPVRSKRIENRGFKFRYQLNFTHKDKLVERNQTFSDPRLAIAKTDEDYNDSHLSYQAFAYRSEKGARIDVLLYRLEAKETFSTVRSSVVLSALGDDPDKSHEIHTAMGIKTTVNKEVNRDFFGPGEVQEGAFFFIHHGPFTKEEATLDNAKKALAWSTAYWKDFKPFENRFEIPDECVEEMLHSCGRNIYQAREVKNNVPVFQVGPTMYRGLWMVDGHFILEAAQVMGNRKDAFDGLLAVLRRVRPDGSIVEMDFHGKETGIAIATLVRQCELMGDDERLKELWPTLLRARDYIAAYRQEAKEMEDYIGVFPSNFGDGGLYGPEPEYTTIHWMLYGLKAGYDAGKRLDLPGYSHFKSLFDEIMTAYDKTVKRDALHTGDGIPYIPQYMLKNEVNRYELDNWVGPPEEISWEGYNPQTGIWAFSQAIGFGEVFDPEDTNVKNLLQLVDSIDDEEGIPAGTAWSTQGLCTYFSMFEAQAWLYCGRGKRFNP